ncbi:hypothetical protein D9M71_634430 [compost metagenome]
MTLHRVTMGEATGSDGKVGVIGRIPIMSSKTLRLERLSCPRLPGRLWRIRQENYAFALLMFRSPRGRWAPIRDA